MSERLIQTGEEVIKPAFDAMVNGLVEQFGEEFGLKAGPGSSVCFCAHFAL